MKRSFWVVLFVGVITSATAYGLPRTTTDRPDDITGIQVKGLYVLGADSPDEGFDTDGTLATDGLVNAKEWLKGQFGGSSLRIDTYQGQPDIMFVRLGQTEDEINNPSGRGLAYFVSEYLDAHGITDENKLYVIFNGAPSYANGACGGYEVVPTNGIIVLPDFEVVLLRDPSGTPCFFPGGEMSPHLTYLGYVTGHETIHASGGVQACAQGWGGFHVSDPHDIMCGSPFPCSTPLWADPKHVAYNACPNCWDVLRSGFFDPPANHHGGNSSRGQGITPIAPSLPAPIDPGPIRGRENQ